jgi:hypothetical protein
MVMGFVFTKQHTSKYKPEDFKTESISLEPFSHIIMNNDGRITLKSGNSKFISYSSITKIPAVSPKYTLRNDTLIIESTQTNRNNQISIITDNLVSISGNNCWVTVSAFKQNSLLVDMKKSVVRFNKNVNITNLSLSLSESSECDSWDFKTEKLTLNTNNSVFRGKFSNRLNSIDGKILGKSEIQLPQALKYKLNVDEKSSIKMY